MQHSIIGYLLGALDDDEMAKFEAQLKNDPVLQEQVREESRRLACLRDDDDIEPPPGLAESTCAMVEELRLDPTPESTLDSLDLALNQSEAVHPRREAAPVWHGARSSVGHDASDNWTLTDALVGCAVVLAACMLFFPAISNSRYHAQITGCQNNLRTIGRALIQYSKADPNGLFPQVPERGNMAFAGMYAPTLKSLGFIEDDSLFHCAASSVGFGRTDNLEIPGVDEVEKAQGEELFFLQRIAGGAYGYSLGVEYNGEIKGIRNRSRNHFALMSDTPTLYKLLTVRPSSRSYVHRNVLFESGCVRVVCIDTECWGGDQLYTNDRGEVSAGVHDADAVIASSATAPLVQTVSYRTP